MWGVFFYMSDDRFVMNKHGDLYDNDELLILDFGYSLNGVSCNKIIDLLNELDKKDNVLERIRTICLEYNTSSKYNHSSEVLSEIMELVGL